MPRKTSNEYESALKASENDVIEAMGWIIRRPCGKDECAGKDETAKVTASVKVLEILADPGSYGKLVEKLEELRAPAVKSLRDVVNNGSVNAAKANAGAALLKLINKSAPQSWPPETTTKKWKTRMVKALELCAI